MLFSVVTKNAYPLTLAKKRMNKIANVNVFYGNRHTTAFVIICEIAMIKYAIDILTILEFVIDISRSELPDDLIIQSDLIISATNESNGKACTVQKSIVYSEEYGPVLLLHSQKNALKYTASDMIPAKSTKNRQ